MTTPHMKEPSVETDTKTSCSDLRQGRVATIGAPAAVSHPPSAEASRPVHPATATSYGGVATHVLNSARSTGPPAKPEMIWVVK